MSIAIVLVCAVAGVGLVGGVTWVVVSCIVCGVQQAHENEYEAYRRQGHQRRLDETGAGWLEQFRDLEMEDTSPGGRRRSSGTLHTQAA